MIKTTLTDGSPITPDHRNIKPNGQQKDYVILSEEERAKGFVRPVRKAYVHDKCGVRTVMALSIAETYARDPKFYSGTFCCGCRSHFPLDEFKWDGTDETVGADRLNPPGDVPDGLECSALAERQLNEAADKRHEDSVLASLRDEWI